MSATQHRFTCDELGMCQSRATPCGTCQHFPFAPGAIERHRRTTSRRARRILTIALAAAAVIGLSLLGITLGV